VSAERYFLDAFFAIALFNRRDQHHEEAKAWLARLCRAGEVWTSEAVLLEIADGLSAANRGAAVSFITWLKRAPNARIVTVDTTLFDRALALYAAREDKTWGMTDCISFLVMKDEGLHDALTADEHFVQAGFKAVMR
jgi:predicted nucleic acid-binding protein